VLDSTVTVAVNPRYADRGKAYKFLFGEHYRQEWLTPVTFRCSTYTEVMRPDPAKVA
jgi:hypothetical protein